MSKFDVNDIVRIKGTSFVTIITYVDLSGDQDFYDVAFNDVTYSAGELILVCKRDNRKDIVTADSERLA